MIFMGLFLVAIVGYFIADIETWKEDVQAIKNLYKGE